MIGHELARELPEMQARAESLMTLTLRAYRPNGTTTDDDGFEVPAYADEGTTPGKVQATSGDDTTHRMVTVGGTERPIMEGGLHLPIGAPVPTPGEYGNGWEYVVEAVGPHDDPALLGRRYLVVSVPAKSHATARRLDVTEV